MQIDDLTMLVYSTLTALALIAASVMLEHTKVRVICISFGILLLIGSMVNIHVNVMAEQDEAWRSPEFKEMRDQLDKLLTEQYTFLRMMGTDKHRYEYVKRWKHSVCDMKF